MKIGSGRTRASQTPLVISSHDEKEDNQAGVMYVDTLEPSALGSIFKNRDAELSDITLPAQSIQELDDEFLLLNLV